MCGRHVSPDEASIEREFNLVHQEWQFPPSFNVAPTQQVPILREADGKRRGSIVRWGLIPFLLAASHLNIRHQRTHRDGRDGGFLSGSVEAGATMPTVCDGIL